METGISVNGKVMNPLTEMETAKKNPVKLKLNRNGIIRNGKGKIQNEMK